MTEGLIDDEQGCFISGKEDQIFTLNQIGEKTREKGKGACGFYGLGGVR